MNPTLKISPKCVKGQASVSTCEREGSSNDILISIRDTFVNPKAYHQAIVQLLDAKEQDDVTIYICSPGGSIAAALQLLSAMKCCKAKITTVATGIAASCGAFVFAHGDVLKMGPAAKVMFHGSSVSSVGGNTVMVGEELQALTKKVGEIIRPAVDKGLITQEEYENMLEKKSDIFLGYNELLERGVQRV